MKKEVDVCDVCENPARPVTRYTVSAKGREGHTDRCTEHGAVLEAILPKPRRRGGRPPASVATMEEVERAKRR